MLVESRLCTVETTTSTANHNISGESSSYIESKDDTCSVLGDTQNCRDASVSSHSLSMNAMVDTEDSEQSDICQDFSCVTNSSPSTSLTSGNSKDSLVSFYLNNYLGWLDLAPEWMREQIMNSNPVQKTIESLKEMDELINKTWEERMKFKFEENDDELTNPTPEVECNYEELKPCHDIPEMVKPDDDIVLDQKILEQVPMILANLSISLSDVFITIMAQTALYIIQESEIKSLDSSFVGDNVENDVPRVFASNCEMIDEISLYGMTHHTIAVC